MIKVARLVSLTFNPNLTTLPYILKYYFPTSVIDYAMKTIIKAVSIIKLKYVLNIERQICTKNCIILLKLYYENINKIALCYYNCILLHYNKIILQIVIAL